MKRFWLLITVVSALSLACSSGGGSSDTSSGPRDTGGLPMSDVAGGYDTAAPTDTAAQDTGADTWEPPEDAWTPPVDVPPPLDIPWGTGAFGEPCDDDRQCESGLCWATSAGSGCTVSCESDQDCDCVQLPGAEDCLPVGLVCHWLGEGRKGCGAPSMSGNPTCTDHGDCRYPYICRFDLGWCELPLTEGIFCRFGEECEADKHCNLDTRRCEANVCTATAQCTSPVEFCVDGSCGPAACETRADCGEGEACSPISGKCESFPPCNDEGACDYYNQVCEDGLCVVNRCANECPNEQAVCDPDFGRCLLPCTTRADCGEEEDCDPGRGRCYVNRIPFARPRVQVGGELLSVATVAAGSSVNIDATASVDPDGTELSYEWAVNSVPPSIRLLPGDPVPGATGPRFSFVPASEGVYTFSLVVTDASGLDSYPAAVVLFVQ